jgi:hypothetical protein
MRTLIKKLLLILCLCSVCQAAQVIRYVDPDVVKAGDGTSWNTAYASLFAWEAAEQKNLVTATENHIVYCRSSSGTDDTTKFTINGWTTSEDYDIQIIGADFPVDGIWDATKYVLIHDDEGDAQAIRIEESHVRIHNLQISVVVTSTSGTAYGILAGATAATHNVQIDSCYIKGTIAADSGVCYGIRSYTNSVTTVTNSIITGFYGNNNCYGLNSYYSTFSIYNCTIVGCWTGIFEFHQTGPTIAKNCIFIDCYWAGNAGVELDYCHTYNGVGTNAQLPVDEQVMGSASIKRTSNTASGYTHLDMASPCTANSTITEVDLYSSGTYMRNVVIGTFYLVSGTTYKCRASAAVANPTGFMRYTGLSLACETGDVIGIYSTAITGGLYRTTSGGTNTMYCLGDKTAPGAEGSYTLQAGYALSLTGFAFDFDWSQDVIDVDNGDFSLVADGNCIGNGTDDPSSGLYSDDIIGTARTSTWDIGAFEYVAAPPASGGQVIMIGEL